MKKMIETTIDFISMINEDILKWENALKISNIRPWFRGESGNAYPLCPKIAQAEYNHIKGVEKYLLESFRRKAGGIANAPDREQTDMWLFLAQHYRVPTRLLDWTEGALLALYFAINQNKENPRVYMLNPHKLNEFTLNINGIDLRNDPDNLNFPYNFITPNTGQDHYLRLAWSGEGQHTQALDLPLAFPAVYQDFRMISQRSCFTIHGKILKPIPVIFKDQEIDIANCLVEYKIQPDKADEIIIELAILGVSAVTVFPDLENLAKDLLSEVKKNNFTSKKLMGLPIKRH